MALFTNFIDLFVIRLLSCFQSNCHRDSSALSRVQSGKNLPQDLLGFMALFTNFIDLFANGNSLSCWNTFLFQIFQAKIVFLFADLSFGLALLKLLLLLLPLLLLLQLLLLLFLLLLLLLLQLSSLILLIFILNFLSLCLLVLLNLLLPLLT